MEALSDKQVEELQRHLVKKHPRFRSRTVTKMVKLVNDLRTGVVKLTDWFPSYENVLRYEDFVENAGLEKFVTQ